MIVEFVIHASCEYSPVELLGRGEISMIEELNLGFEESLPLKLVSMHNCKNPVVMSLIPAATMA